ncbi:hypothetical protein uvFWCGRAMDCOMC449_034 [Freshwater phage uvFW-CGR-AMD-COM-C449]|nr:hypothetical protein uvFWCGRAMDCOMC449_034 [Freshwater phage uvFW-CGR-AMD-COM-C449]
MALIMGEIIIMGLNGGAKVLPMTATKQEIVGAMLAKCGHEDLLGYFGNTYCKACADDGHKRMTRGK